MKHHQLRCLLSSRVAFSNASRREASTSAAASDWTEHAISRFSVQPSYCSPLHSAYKDASDKELRRQLASLTLRAHNELARSNEGFDPAQCAATSRHRIQVSVLHGHDVCMTACMGNASSHSWGGRAKQMVCDHPPGQMIMPHHPPCRAPSPPSPMHAVKSGTASRHPPPHKRVAPTTAQEMQNMAEDLRQLSQRNNIAHCTSSKLALVRIGSSTLDSCGVAIELGPAGGQGLVCGWTMKHFAGQ